MVWASLAQGRVAAHGICVRAWRGAPGLTPQEVQEVCSGAQQRSGLCGRAPLCWALALVQGRRQCRKCCLQRSSRSGGAHRGGGQEQEAVSQSASFNKSASLRFVGPAEQPGNRQSKGRL